MIRVYPSTLKQINYETKRLNYHTIQLIKKFDFPIQDILLLEHGEILDISSITIKYKRVCKFYKKVLFIYNELKELKN